MHHDGPGTIDDLQEIISPETGYRGGSTESVFQKCLDRHPGALEHMNVQEFVFFRQGASRTGVGRTQYLRAFASGVRGLVIESHGWSRHLFLLSSLSSFLETQMVGRPRVPYSFFGGCLCPSGLVVFSLSDAAPRTLFRYSIIRFFFFILCSSLP